MRPFISLAHRQIGPFSGDYGQPEFYAPNGTPRGGSIVANPCLFTGQRYDAESGLYWCKTRYLEPETGRFTTRDILGIWGDPANLGNGYTYAANNPWSMLDPFGMCSDGETGKGDSSQLDSLRNGLEAMAAGTCELMASISWLR